MIFYKSNQYSVPVEYIGKKLNLQVEDNYLYLYDNMKLVVSRLISEKRYSKIITERVENKNKLL